MSLTDLDDSCDVKNATATDVGIRLYNNYT